MSKIPCRKCNGCGVYHDLSVLTCSECGKDISSIPALLIETEEIPVEYYGEIDENVTVYVQKCSACGALNFTSDANKRVRVCCNCHKTRVAAIAPTAYKTEQTQDDDTDQDNSDEITSSNNISEKKTSKSIDGKEAKEAFSTVSDKLASITNGDEDDDDDDDDDSAQWNSLLGNIRKSIGSPADTSRSHTGLSMESHVEEPAIEINSSGKTYDDEDDDDDVSDWSGILGGKSEPKKKQPQQEKPEITLTALRYGRLSFSIKAESDSPYLLGRSGNQSAFLSNDRRVGNEHCYLIFKNGKWYVKDNHSSNGTAVNSIDIGLNGEHVLADGDELKLGHHPDSMAFRITIT